MRGAWVDLPACRACPCGAITTVARVLHCFNCGHDLIAQVENCACPACRYKRDDGTALAFDLLFAEGYGRSEKPMTL